MTVPPPVIVLGVDQVAELLRCAETTVRERAAELGGIKLGRDWVFPAAALDRRLCELALASAPAPAPAPSPDAPRPTAVLHALPGRKATRRKPPPALPQL